MATEIKYKDTTIPVEAGQTVTLNTADKKLTGDIEVTAPKESGGGAKKYNITWDTSGLKAYGYYGIFSLPENVYEGQTVVGIVAYSWDTIIHASGCSLTTKIGDSHTILVDHLEDYRDRTPTGIGFAGYLCIMEISNPTGDVYIWFEQSGGGSN